MQGVGAERQTAAANCEIRSGWNDQVLINGDAVESAARGGKEEGLAGEDKGAARQGAAGQIPTAGGGGQGDGRSGIVDASGDIDDSPRGANVAKGGGGDLPAQVENGIAGGSDGVLIGPV